MRPVPPLYSVLKAIVVFLSGITMTLRPSLVGDFLGVDAPILLQLVGIGLVVLAVELVYRATQRCRIVASHTGCLDKVD